MNTKVNSVGWNSKSESGQALIVTILLLALIVVGMIIVMDGVGRNPFAVITVHAMGVNVRESFVLKGQVYYSLRGDCFADRASNDFYATPDNDIVCKSSYFVMHATNGVKDDIVNRVVAIQPAKKHHKHNQLVVNETVTQPAAVDNGDKQDKPQDKPQEKGNPGNHKPVGNAGEDPNNKGTMPLDSGSSNGNGEHGNQGQGGKHGAVFTFGLLAFLRRKFANPVQITSKDLVVMKAFYTKYFHLNWYIFQDSSWTAWANSCNEKGYHAYYIRLGRLYFCPTLFI